MKPGLMESFWAALSRFCNARWIACARRRHSAQMNDCETELFDEPQTREEAEFWKVQLNQQRALWVMMVITGAAWVAICYLVVNSIKP